MQLKQLLFLLVCATFFFSCEQEPKKVACVGDSITEGPGHEHPDSYPLQLQQILGEDYIVKNFGVSGRTLLRKGDYPFWNEPQFEEVSTFEPDIVVIMLGTNDSKPQNWQHKDEFKADYIALIENYRKAMPSNGKVYVCIPVPVTADNYGINQKTLIEMRPMLEEIAFETNAEIIDLHAPLAGHTDLFPDGVHPNTEGLQIMAETVAENIR